MTPLSDRAHALIRRLRSSGQTEQVTVADMLETIAENASVEPEMGTDEFLAGCADELATAAADAASSLYPTPAYPLTDTAHAAQSFRSEDEVHAEVQKLVDYAGLRLLEDTAGRLFRAEVTVRLRPHDSGAADHSPGATVAAATTPGS